MIRATIFRQENDNVWLTVLVDNVRDTRKVSRFEMLDDAVDDANTQGAKRIRLMMGDATVNLDPSQDETKEVAVSVS